MATLFISDLHLHPARLAINRCFLGFLEATQGNADALYILGDLFESWVGDDHPEPTYASVRQALKRCSLSGTPVFLLHGNRDFLLGERFATETGCTLLADPTRIDLCGISTLLMHGDSLCTDDSDYQRLRARVRDPAWQRQALGLPLEERLELAAQARELSALSIGAKGDDIMDVNQQEVLRMFASHDVNLLIHGHTHRPGIHQFEYAGRQRRRIVLGAWYQQGSVLSVEDGKLELRNLPA
jgi:UDP-2,3-diacylglucosamine hydrolase